MSLGASLSKDEEEAKGRRDSGLMAITGSGGPKRVGSMDDIRKSRRASTKGRRGSAGLDVSALARLTADGVEEGGESNAKELVATSEILRMQSRTATGTGLGPIQSGVGSMHTDVEDLDGEKGGEV